MLYHQMSQFIFLFYPSEPLYICEYAKKISLIQQFVEAASSFNVMEKYA